MSRTRAAPAAAAACMRSARTRARCRHRPRAAAGEGDPPSPLRLSGLRRGGGAGAGPGAADHRRDGDRGAAGPRAGGQVRRFSAALSPVADLRPAGHRARPLHALRLGRAGLLVAGAVVAPAAPARHGLDPDLRRRHHVPVLEAGGGPRPGVWGYVRDDRPFGGNPPPAVAFFYAEDRKGEHPAATWPGSRASCRRTPTPASRACYENRPPGPILAVCWAHTIRTQSSVARHGGSG